MPWIQGKALKGDRMPLSSHGSIPWLPSACCSGHRQFCQCLPTARSCFVTVGRIKWFHSLHFWSPWNTVVRDLGINSNVNTKCTNYLLFTSGQAKLHPALCPPKCCSNFHSQQGSITPQLWTFFKYLSKQTKHCCWFISVESQTAQSQLDPYLVTKQWPTLTLGT